MSRIFPLNSFFVFFLFSKSSIIEFFLFLPLLISSSYDTPLLIFFHNILNICFSNHPCSTFPILSFRFLNTWYLRHQKHDQKTRDTQNHLIWMSLINSYKTMRNQWRKKISNVSLSNFVIYPDQAICREPLVCCEIFK